MKVTIEQAKELLSEILGDVELVEADNADKDFDLDAILAKGKDYYKADLSKEALEVTENEVHGKVIKSLRSVVGRTFSIPRKDMENMTVDQIISKVKENVEAGSASGATEWKEKYDTLLQNSEKEKDDLENTWKQKYDDDIAVERTKYVDRDVNDYVRSQMEKLPRKGGDLNAQTEVLRYRLEKLGYKPKMSEDGSTVEWEKDGKKITKFEEVIKTEADKTFGLAKDTSHIKPSDVLAGKENGAKAGVVAVDNPQGNGFGDMSAIAALAGEEAA